MAASKACATGSGGWRVETVACVGASMATRSCRASMGLRRCDKNRSALLCVPERACTIQCKAGTALQDGLTLVIPAQAGIQRPGPHLRVACAGMTLRDDGQSPLACAFTSFIASIAITECA